VSGVVFPHMSLSFFKQWLKAPATVGAVAPSSRCLADAMADGVESFEAIVEVGAGSGVWLNAPPANVWHLSSETNW
jgi:phospholipid N-methyltransferase